MHPDPIVVQAAISIPVSLGLVIYTLIRWERAAVHGMLAVLLTSVIVWLTGVTLKAAGGSEWMTLLGLHLEIGASIFMPPLFLITMGYFARSALFEQSLAPSLGLLSVSAAFLIAYATDGHHHFFVADPAAALAGQPPSVWAGPVFWALQIWTAAADLTGFVYCGGVLFRGPTPAERGRAAMIFAAVLIPSLAHIVYMLKLLPIDYTLSPGTIAFTAAFFVQGIHRYGLLGGQTIVRHDLIEHLRDGLVLSDENGIVVDANAAAEATLKKPRSELRGFSLPEVLGELEVMNVARALGDQIVALPLEADPVEGEVLTDDGRVIHVTGGGVPALASQPGGRFVSLQDRTDQRRNERLLRERQKLESVGLLAAGVAHEVNNPLAYVRANLTHLEASAARLAKHESARDLDDLVEMPELLTESIEGLDRIARIVAGMLRFSRVPDETQRPVDVDGLVEEAIRLADLKRGTAVRAKYSGDGPLCVMGSPERLVQVLLNLFLNAKHAAGDRQDAIIEAETTRVGAYAVVHIRDNGPGIPEELQERIFDPFFTTRSPGEGTGLGLSIAFDIVREHGGTLELTSKPGDGCCFSIRVPIAAPQD